MKKAFTVLIVALLAVSIFTSCAESEKVATMRITLSSETSRLISPDGISLDVSSYQITGSGPGGSTFSVTTSKSSATLTGLAVGEWSLVATGYNNSGYAIVTGSTNFTLSTSNTSAVIVLDSLVGNGTLSITMQWDTSVVSRPSLEVELTKQGESSSQAVTTNINTSDGVAYFTLSDLEAGSYILQGRLYSDGILVSGFTEAVRIVADNVASSTIEFSLDSFPYAPGTLQLLDQSGIPVECTIEGLSSEVNAGESVTVTLTPSRSNLGDVTVLWYVDGEYVASGMSAELTFSVGNHRLDAVAYTDKIGSYGSCSVAFSALVKTEVGVPGNAVTIDTSSGLKLGASTLLSFMPDGKLMVMSGNHDSLQIASILRNTVSIEKEYGTATLSALACDPVDLGYTLIDTSGTYAVLVVMNNSSNSARFNYVANTSEVSQIEQCSGVISSYSGDSTKFGSAVGSVLYDSITKNFAFLAKDTTGKSTYIIERLVEGTSSSKDYAYRGTDLSAQLSSNLGLSMSSIVALAVDPKAAEYYLAGSENGNIVKMNHRSMLSGSVQIKNDYEKTSLTASKYSGLIKILISDNGIAYILGENYIAGYNPDSDTEIFYSNISGVTFSDFVINEVTGNIYLLSYESSKLYSYSMDSGGTLSKETVMETLNASRNLALSLDGSYLILYSKENSASLELMRISTY